MTSDLSQLKFVSLNESLYDSSSPWFLSLGLEETLSLNQADIIVFNGGADIGTEIYNEQPAVRGVPREASLRDRNEIAIFKEYKSKFKLGICRGSQLLNCLNGGTLWQDVNNHGRSHNIYDLQSGLICEATSTHHQMMRPNLETGQVIAVAKKATTKISYKDNWFKLGREEPYDTEIVWYPHTRSLCIQGHPEYVPGSVFANYCADLIATFYEMATEECAD